MNDPPAGLQPYPDAPRYAIDGRGRVWLFGHPRQGPVWFELRTIKELARVPGTSRFRRTGRRYFVVFTRSGLVRHDWEPPESEPELATINTTEEPDEFTF